MEKVSIKGRTSETRKRDEKVRALPTAVATAPEEHLMVKILTFMEASFLGLEPNQLFTPNSAHFIAIFLSHSLRFHPNKTKIGSVRHKIPDEYDRR